MDISRDTLYKFPPPDLVYRHGDPEVSADPSLKAIVTEDRFAVLIQGGATKDFDTGYAYPEELGWKLCRVLVTAEANGQVLAQTEADVMFRTVRRRSSQRFSPDEHEGCPLFRQKKMGFAYTGTFFPGYWRCADGSVCEIPRRWRANDALEYIGGRVHAVIYNIKEKRCATQEVEIGRMAFEGWRFRGCHLLPLRHRRTLPAVRNVVWIRHEEREDRCVRKRRQWSLYVPRQEIVRIGIARKIRSEQLTGMSMIPYQ